ncbi:hypothetical protein JKG47_10280 [Acidithiobacillus sp. MC6.1]|nr:hypothetical protein [Acidithiobacillus sp. MC6.1]
MTYIMKSPLTLYRAFRAATVPDDTAKEAAYAVSADLEVIIGQLVRKQEMAIDDARMDSVKKGRIHESQEHAACAVPELQREISLLKNSLVEWLLAVTVAQTVFVIVILALVFSGRQAMGHSIWQLRVQPIDSAHSACR